MSRSPSKSTLRRRGNERPDRPVTALDPIAKDTLKLLAFTFDRCGFEPEQLVSEFRSALKRAPRSAASRKPHPWELHDPGHVLTLWTSDPDYVDEEGRPLPIPVYGPAPSFEALVRRVESTLSLETVLKILVRSGAVRKQGDRLRPIDDFVLHAPRSEPQSVHHLLVLHQLLQNFEFNAQRSAVTPSWPQRVADCPDFPQSELPAFIERFHDLAKRFMRARDQDMVRIARKAAPGPRVRPEINLFLTVDPVTRIPTKKRR